MPQCATQPLLNWNAKDGNQKITFKTLNNCNFASLNLKI